MTSDEAIKLARELSRAAMGAMPKNADHMEAAYFRQIASPQNVIPLCDYILSGDMKREIENAAFERAAKLIEEPIAGLEAQHASWRESLGQDCAQPYREEIQLLEALAQTMRSLIQPLAQKENGE